MSNEIKPGDLVMVVRPTLCCGNASSIGTVGIAGSMATYDWSICHYCQHIHNEVSSEVLVGEYSYEMVRLKKIDPPALAEETETNREMETV